MLWVELTAIEATAGKPRRTVFWNAFLSLFAKDVVENERDLLSVTNLG